jgi:branched-chain amino acid transport system ATP-binding protein
MLEVEEIACSYGKIEALRKVSLQANPNAVTCLLGPNGAGKTTLMMSLAGILKPNHGSIKFEGQNLIGLTPSQIVQRGLALVPENRLVFPALTVRENLMAGAYLRKDRAGVANDIEQQLNRFPRLRERIDQLAGTLSGGEQQMLALGRALMSRPRLLLMDEPSVGLAPKVVAEIFGIIQKLHHEGTSIFLVEQNVHMAMKVAQHFYLLQQGRVTFSGTPAQLAEDDLVQRAYLAGHSATA